MASWGHRNFENDSALDFVADVEEKGLQKIQEAINLIAEAGETEHLSAADCTNALAAIEFIAAAKGKQSEDFPEDAEDWLNAQDAKALLSISNDSILAVIERIRNNSELSELWDNAGADDWFNVLDNLEDRIS